MTDLPPSDPLSGKPASAPAQGAKTRIVDALMELAGERRWDDITISDIALRAGVSLSEFRDSFPSKGAVLAGFSRNIDKIVLDGSGAELMGEPAKERLFDVLMRRLDAMKPYKNGIDGVMEWARRDPLAAAALNRSAVNSMRFMLEAAGIGSEGPFGAVKLQGLVLAWGRILSTWIRDDDPGLSRTMAALDRELARGSSLVNRVDDLDRLVSPLRAIARAVIERPRSPRASEREGRPFRDERDDGSTAVI